MSEDNYFSWENFNELAGIGQHIEFITRTIDRYNWPDDVREHLMSELKLVKDKQNDKRLNLSVIGEFSSGKSTFINSLIRCQLLTSAVLQGTTLVSTVIEYDTRHSITLEYRDGNTDRREYRDIQELKNDVSSLTTSSETAQQIKMLRVGLPSEALNKGIRIIDTPGTNAIEEWHEEVTRATLNDVSDLSIVLIDPMRPVSQSLVDFLQSAIPELMGQSIYVITKFDTLHDGEHHRMDTYVKRKLTGIIGHMPIVLKYSSVSVLDNMAGALATDNEHVVYSLESEKSLLEYMTRERQRAISRKLVSLINTLLHNLDIKVKEIQAASLAELSLLEKSKQADLSEFVESKTLKYIDKFSTENIEFRKQIQTECDAIEQRILTNIYSDINAISTLDALKAYTANNKITDICNDECESMRSIVNDYQAKHYAEYEGAIDSFKQVFEQHFRDLELLQVSMSTIMPAESTRMVIGTHSISEASNYVNDQLSKENWAMGSGAAVGAIIGSMVAPVIGTIIGGLLGSFFGLSQAPKIEDVRESLKAKLKEPLRKFAETVKKDVIKSFTDNSTAIANLIADEISRYLKEYRNEVDRRLTDYNNRLAEVTSRIKMIEEDLKQIENHKVLINSLISKINDGYSTN